MSDRVRCNCPQCAIRGLMGPAILVTLGILFLLDQLRGGYFSFGNTFPVILIVIGLISLASALASTEGHVSDSVPPAPAAAPPPPQNPYAGQAQARYPSLANALPPRRSLFPGLALIFVGLLILVHNYRGLDIPHLLWRWWPLLIISWGAIKLYERAVASRSGQPSASPISR